MFHDLDSNIYIHKLHTLNMIKWLNDILSSCSGNIDTSSDGLSLLSIGSPV